MQFGAIVGSVRLTEPEVRWQWIRIWGWVVTGAQPVRPTGDGGAHALLRSPGDP